MSGYSSPSSSTSGFSSPVSEKYADSESVFSETDKDLEAGFKPVKQRRQSIQFPSKGKDLYKKVIQYNSCIFPFTMAATFYRTSCCLLPNHHFPPWYPLYPPSEPPIWSRSNLGADTLFFFCTHWPVFWKVALATGWYELVARPNDQWNWFTVFQTVLTVLCLLTQGIPYVTVWGLFMPMRPDSYAQAQVKRDFRSLRVCLVTKGTNFKVCIKILCTCLCKPYLALDQFFQAFFIYFLLLLLLQILFFSSREENNDKTMTRLTNSHYTHTHRRS